MVALFATSSTSTSRRSVAVGGAVLRRRVGGTALAIAVVTLAAATPALPACVGDCDGSGRIAVNELVSLVRIVLGNASLAECTAGDANGDGEISVEEIVAAVARGLDGCPLAPGRTLDDLFGDVAPS